MRAGAVAVVLSSVLVVGACGGDDDPQAGPATTVQSGSGDSPTEAPPAQQARDACGLIPAAEVETIAGGAVAPESITENEIITTCNYEDPATGVGYLYLRVTWASGGQAWQIWQDSMGLADDIWQDTEGVSLGEVNVEGAGPVPGLGDKAYYGGIFPSLVLQGDVLLELTMPLLDDPEESFPALAQGALSRL